MKKPNFKIISLNAIYEETKPSSQDSHECNYCFQEEFKCLLPLTDILISASLANIYHATDLFLKFSEFSRKSFLFTFEVVININTALLNVFRKKWAKFSEKLFQ